MKSRKKVEEINLAHSNYLYNPDNKKSTINFLQFNLRKNTNEIKKPPQTSQTKKRVDIFSNYNNILNSNFQEDFRNCYNLNINGTKLNLFKEKKAPEEEDKIKLKKIKPKININFIVDSQLQLDESENNSLVGDLSSNEDLNFRKTFLTNLIKPIEEKPSHKYLVKTHNVENEFEFFKKESSFDLKNFINEVSSAQKKINDEAEEIQKMLKYTKAAKVKLKSKLNEDKLKSELTSYYRHLPLEAIRYNKSLHNDNKKNLDFRNTQYDLHKSEIHKLKNLEKMKSYKNKFLNYNKNNLSGPMKIDKHKSLPIITKILQ